MEYRVKEVADLAGVSVRTLHHYHEIGLLVPASTSSSGYRLYTEDNLERLQQILFFKELGFSLSGVKEILEKPDFDRKAALTTHKELLVKKRARLDEIIETVEKTLSSIEGGIKMADKDMFKGFDMEEIERHQKKYSEEAKQKYGRKMVEAVEEKTSQYGIDDWETINAMTNSIYKKIGDRMEHGPADPAVQEEVAKWRQLITDHFYECTTDIFRGLGDLYVMDERFTKNIDRHKEGLAAFLREAMHVYCENHEK
ncbi:MerR family transcriptional regulator [Pseudalkalibacillus caeni]|uniref:MerR family transcriptional regulator n=1 Tax=Exobacillus caeni TaxID=2574798 RepID=A0A5R9EZ03_9BACL|nr:MerR family transcriptional regulator [Pseudalkalibacillus caeni]TLS36061.1 MerR family transcriptional regulator [Pseudalkalibacillus caeni]